MQERKLIRKVLLFVVASFLGWNVLAAPTLVSVDNDETVEVGENYNGHSGGTIKNISSASHALVLGTGVTVKLDSTAAVNGVFTLYANIYAPDGGFTVDASDITTIRWIGGVESSGTVTVKGATDIQFGDTVTNNSKSETNMSFFKADVVFDGGTGAITFVNAVTLAKLPTCSYSIAAETHVGVAAKNVFAGSENVYTVDQFDLTLTTMDALDAKTVAVKSGRYVTVFPCNKIQFGTDETVSYNFGRWAWGGSAGQICPYDFELSDGSELGVYGSQVGHTFSGTIAGAGKLTLGMTASRLPGNILFTGSVNHTGLVTLLNCSSIHCDGAGTFAFGDVDCSAYASKGNTFTFKTPAAALIGTLAGGIKVVGTAASALTVGGLAAGAQLDVDGAVEVTIGSAAETAVVNLLGTSGGWTVQGPTGSTVALSLSPATAGKTLNVGGKLSLGDLGSTFATLNLLAGAELSGTTVDAGVTIAGQGKISYAGNSWKNKIYLWTDSTATSTVVPVREVFTETIATRKPVAKTDTSSPEYDLVYDWNDCRGNVPFKFRSMRSTDQNDYNTMGSSPVPTYPFLVTNVNVSATAEKPGYMSFAGAQPSSRQTSLLAYNEAKSTWAVVDQPTAYAIVVFGSQQGGGAGILGSKDATLSRTYSKTTDEANNPMFAGHNYQVYADGAPVQDSTVTGLNGGWQILSIDTENKLVQGLGFDRRSGNYAAYGTNRGYSNYAEVMLFSEAPTENERKVIEKMLATKWGLPCFHDGYEKDETLNLSPAGGLTPAAKALVAYPDDDIPRNVTVNVNVPNDFKRGVRYPLVSYGAATTVTLGSVTGKTVSGLEVVQENGMAYLTAPESGMVLIFR